MPPPTMFTASRSALRRGIELAIIRDRLSARASIRHLPWCNNGSSFRNVAFAAYELRRANDIYSGWIIAHQHFKIHCLLEPIQ